MRERNGDQRGERARREDRLIKIKGERALRGTRVVQKMGGGGSRGVVLNLELPIEVGDQVRQSILPDGTIRLAVMPKKVARGRRV